MKTYTISVPITGRIEVTVEADNIQDAIANAKDAAKGMLEDGFSIDPERETFDTEEE